MTTRRPSKACTTPAPGSIAAGAGKPKRSGKVNAGRSSEVCALRADEFGAAGGWTWEAWIRRGAGGAFSAALFQSSLDPDDGDDLSAYELERFTSGHEFFDFINEAWVREHGEYLDFESWKEVAASVDPFDPELSHQILDSARTQSDSSREVAEPDGGDPSGDEVAALRRCIAGATWDRGKRPGGGGAMWAAIGDARQAEQAIDFYVRAYMATHDRPPSGRHRVRVTFGTVGSGADCEPGPMSAGPGVFDKDVDFL